MVVVVVVLVVEVTVAVVEVTVVVEVKVIVLVVVIGMHAAILWLFCGWCCPTGHAGHVLWVESLGT